LTLPASSVLIGTPAIGVVVGFLSGVFGVGGGFIMTPALHILLGIPYPVAVGSGLFAIPFYSVAGILRHRRLGHVQFPLAFLTFAFMVPGIFLGTILLEILSTTSNQQLNVILDLCFLLVILVSSVMVINEYRRWKLRAAPPVDLTTIRYQYALRHPPTPPLVGTILVRTIPLAVLGLISGFLSGLLGVGGGFILVPAFTAMFRLPSVVAIGTSLVIVALSSLGGALMHLHLGNVDLVIVPLLAAGALLGTIFGSSLTPKLRGSKIRLGFLLVLVAAMVMIAASYLQH